MKKELSALEIGYLVNEFQCLLSAKIDSISNPIKNETYITFFMPSKGKITLRVLPNFIYLTDEKKTVENPSGFCMFLRKHLSNARVRKVEQVASERIIEFSLETKDQKFILIIELFSKGNIILCQENYWIIGLLESQEWKDRDLRAGITYKQPPKRIDFYKLSEKEAKEALDNDKTLVKKLAIDLGLSGVYAEEVCLLTKIDKNKTEKLNEKEIKLIIQTIKDITNKKEEAFIFYKDDLFFDSVPFFLEKYKELKQDKFNSYSEALNFVFKNNLIESVDNEKKKSYEKRIKQLENTSEKQREHIAEIEQDIKENEKKAELIYTHYNTIKEILEQMKKASEKYSWQEMKDKLKGHKIIKEVNSKDKKLVLELD
jgi:predicted ribosome quality control (RQC) complex YloA/Tae2 family protein